MSHELWFVEGNVLNPHNAIGFGIVVGNAIDHQERIAMREHLGNSIDIKHTALRWRLLIASHRLLFFVEPTNLACELNIGCMAWPCCQNLCTQWRAYQGKITDHVKQLVTCRLIFESQRIIVQDTIGTHHGIAFHTHALERCTEFVV